MSGTAAHERPLALRRPWWSRLIYGVCRRISAGLLVLLYRLRVENKRAVPREGAVLIVANHQSHFDPPAIGGLIAHRQLTFLARGGLFKFGPFGALITALNSIPLKEDGNDKAAITAVIEGLKLGQAVMVFPEGSRTHDGEMQEFKRGALLIARRAKCPVLPVAIEGAFDAWPRSRTLPRLFGRRIRVRYGEPIPSEELLAEADPLARLEREVGELRAALCAVNARRA